MQALRVDPVWWEERNGKEEREKESEEEGKSFFRMYKDVPLSVMHINGWLQISWFLVLVNLDVSVVSLLVRKDLEAH